jgi:NTP pyrophosphatase (non-canonical NTP hydrolase)
MNEQNSLNMFQKKIDEFIKKHGGYWPPLSMLSAIIEEVGELAREINHLEGYKPKKKTETTSDLGEELADLIFAIICMANHYNINLELKLKQIIQKYNERDAKRFI